MDKQTGSRIAEAFADVLQGVRKRRDLGLVQAADRASIHANDWMRLECGQDEPTISALIRCAYGVGASPVVLLEEVISWVNINEAFSSDMSQAKGRVETIGTAFVAALAGLTAQDMKNVRVPGGVLVYELSRRGLLIIPHHSIVHTLGT